MPEPNYSDRKSMCKQNSPRPDQGLFVCFLQQFNWLLVWICRDRSLPEKQATLYWKNSYRGNNYSIGNACANKIVLGQTVTAPGAIWLRTICLLSSSINLLPESIYPDHQLGKACANKIAPDQTAPREAIWSRTICLPSSAIYWLLKWICPDHKLEESILEFQHLKR